MIAKWRWLLLQYSSTPRCRPWVKDCLGQAELRCSARLRKLTPSVFWAKGSHGPTAEVAMLASISHHALWRSCASRWRTPLRRLRPSASRWSISFRRTGQQPSAVRRWPQSSSPAASETGVYGALLAASQYLAEAPTGQFLIRSCFTPAGTKLWLIVTPRADDWNRLTTGRAFAIGRFPINLLMTSLAAVHDGLLTWLCSSGANPKDLCLSACT